MSTKGNYRAEVLADSLSPQGVRLTTLLAVLPRFLLPEFNTHRLFGRNSRSSRAVSTEKNIEQVAENPFVPETFHQRVKGMGVGQPLDREKQKQARFVWRKACQDMIHAATRINNIGIDKSRANRLLETFGWHTVIVTATEWDNFFALRAPDSSKPQVDFPAQLEMQQIAILMRKAMDQSEPRQLDDGEWHRPLVAVKDIAEIAREFPHEGNNLDTLANILSVRRCARVSFDLQFGDEDLEPALQKGQQLAKDGHFSPFEHVARPLLIADIQPQAFGWKLHIPVSLLWETEIPLDQIWSGNLRGWMQFRKMIPHEYNHREVLESEAEK